MWRFSQISPYDQTALAVYRPSLRDRTDTFWIYPCTHTQLNGMQSDKDVFLCISSDKKPPRRLVSTCVDLCLCASRWTSCLQKWYSIDISLSYSRNMKTFKQPSWSALPDAADNVALYRADKLVTLVLRPGSNELKRHGSTCADACVITVFGEREDRDGHREGHGLIDPGLTFSLCLAGLSFSTRAAACPACCGRPWLLILIKTESVDINIKWKGD